MEQKQAKVEVNKKCIDIPAYAFWHALLWQSQLFLTSLASTNFVAFAFQRTYIHFSLYRVSQQFLDGNLLFKPYWDTWY